MLFNGKEYSVEEIQKLMSDLKALQALQKEAKKAGLITKTVTAAAKEKSANFKLMLAQFSPVIDTNRSIVAALFTEFKEQDSISFDADKEYHVIIRSKAVVKAKQEARKAKAAEEINETTEEINETTEEINETTEEINETTEETK